MSAWQWGFMFSPLFPPFRECLKRSPHSPKVEGSDSVTSQSSPSEEAGMMTEVKVKTEVPDDYIEEVIWQDDTKDSKKNIKDGPGDVPAEICVVIGGVRNQQTLGKLWDNAPHQSVPWVPGVQRGTKLWRAVAGSMALLEGPERRCTSVSGSWLRIIYLL